MPSASKEDRRGEAREGPQGCEDRRRKKVVDIKDAPKKVASQEKLIAVLLAPHITEKTSLAMQNTNTYSFRVRRDSTKPDIKAAVELMFNVKVAGVQVVNETGKTRRFGKVHGPHPGHQESLRSSGPRPDDRLRSQDQGLKVVRHASHQDETDFAGHALRRQARQVAPAQGRAVRAADGQAEAATRDATTSAASPRATRAAVPSTSTASSTSVATRTASRAWSSVSSTIRTAPATSR